MATFHIDGMHSLYVPDRRLSLHPPLISVSTLLSDRHRLPNVISSHISYLEDLEPYVGPVVRVRVNRGEDEVFATATPLGRYRL